MIKNSNSLLRIGKRKKQLTLDENVDVNQSSNKSPKITDKPRLLYRSNEDKLPLISSSSEYESEDEELDRFIKNSPTQNTKIYPKPMDIDPNQEIGEGSAGIYQGLSDGFANMSIQGKTTSAQSHLAQSHSAPQTATSPFSFNPTKTNDPNKTIGS